MSSSSISSSSNNSPTLDPRRISASSTSPPSSAHTITPSSSSFQQYQQYSSASSAGSNMGQNGNDKVGPPATLPATEAHVEERRASGSNSAEAGGSSATSGGMVNGSGMSKRKGVRMADGLDGSSSNSNNSQGRPGLPAISTAGVAGQNAQGAAGGRARSSSLVQVTKVEATPDQLLDQSAGFNANADWVNYKGAWVIHVVLIGLGKILLDVVPGMHQEISWTIVNIGYMSISYIMFHYVTGTPFESNSGAYDELTLWEQIDDGAQYTPAKKWLTSVPIMLFLISTHYTRYNPWLFSLNFFVTLFVLFPKLPVLHRLRFKIATRASPYPSLPPTPTGSRPATPAFARR